MRQLTHDEEGAQAEVTMYSLGWQLRLETERTRGQANSFPTITAAIAQQPMVSDCM
jgi:hypothetical protein